MESVATLRGSRDNPCRRRWPVRLALLTLLGVYPIMAASADTGPGLQLFRTGQIADAMQSWSAAADTGDGQAALYLGALYDTGIGVPRDPVLALAWYKRAASAGDTRAMFNVGVMYDAGLGTAADPSMAVEWYGRAAAKGFGRAEYNLALLTQSGTGVARNDRLAMTLYKDAAKHGISAARAHLALLGRPYAGPTRRSDDSSMLAFRQAQQQLMQRGVAEAAAAIPMFQRAARGGNALAEYDLGYLNEHGIGIKADPAQALEYYRRAEQHSNDPAIRTMARTAEHALEQQTAHATQ